MAIQRLLHKGISTFYQKSSAILVASYKEKIKALKIKGFDQKYCYNFYKTFFNFYK